MDWNTGSTCTPLIWWRVRLFALHPPASCSQERIPWFWPSGFWFRGLPYLACFLSFVLAPPDTLDFTDRAHAGVRHPKGFRGPRLYWTNTYLSIDPGLNYCKIAISFWRSWAFHWPLDCRSTSIWSAWKPAAIPTHPNSRRHWWEIWSILCYCREIAAPPFLLDFQTGQRPFIQLFEATPKLFSRRFFGSGSSQDSMSCRY